MPALLARRLTAAVAVLVLPLVAVAGCGAQKKASIRGELTAAGQSLQDAKALTVTVHVQDVKDALRGLLTKAPGGSAPQIADAVLLGSVAVTVDAAGNKTLRELGAGATTAPTAERLKSLNMAIVVSGKDGPLAQLRLVEGVLYANVDLTKIKALVESRGTKDFDAKLDAAGEGAPPVFAQLLKDIRAGKWVKLSLVDHLKEITSLTSGLSPQAGAASKSPAPTFDKTLFDKLYAAIKPYVTVTDANNSSQDRVLDVKVALKPAVKAALASFKGAPGFAALDSLDTAKLDTLKDGTVNGTITLKKSHLTKITLDLASVQAVSPSKSGDVVTGGLLVVDIDDSAAELTAPTDVSSTDLDKLFSELFSGLLGSRRGSQPSNTTPLQS